MTAIEAATSGTPPSIASATRQQAVKASETPVASAHSEPMVEPRPSPVIEATSCVCLESDAVRPADELVGSSKKPISCRSSALRYAARMLRVMRSWMKR